MKCWPRKYQAILGAVVVTSLATVPSAKSCGDFRKPETHFDGVNEYGFVSYWDQLGEIKLADGSVLPLIMGFRSDWETLSPSPHLGSGWLLGLLDAHFVQRSENAFDMISIDGYTVPFGRDPKNSSILNGAQGWKAEIKGDVVTAWAECGWKLQFTKGKISAITTPKNSAIEIRRDRTGLVTNVVEGTKVILKTSTDSKGRINGLSLGNGDEFLFNLAERPKIQRINDINVIGSKEYSISSIQMPNNKRKDYDYTPNSLLQPRITVSDSEIETRSLTWDPTSRLIIGDGVWTYTIVPADNPGHNAAISRTNLEGVKQSWFYDLSKGEEVSSTGKIVTTKRHFTSGLLAGKLRDITVLDNNTGTLTKLHSTSYNEAGEVIREQRRSKEFVYKNGRLTQLSSETGSYSLNYITEPK